MKKIIEAFIKEIVPIVIGILIALYINNWNEDRKDQNYIDRISASITKELIETNTDINEKLEKQKMLIDTLDFYMNDETMSLDKVINKAQGIYIPSIKLNSWKALASSKIELMDYEELSTLADIEEQKELLKMKSNRMVDFIYGNFRETSKDAKETMRISMSEVISTEKSLQKDVLKLIEIEKN